MQVSFHGAAHTVTGSQHLITVNGYKVLLDCGLYQGKREESRRRNQTLPFNASEVDAMVLSHAHIDHSGNIPNLVKSGFSGRIICTNATGALCNTMLLDSGYIQEKDAEYANKKRAKRGEPPIEPIYTQEDAAESLSHFEGVEYSQPYHLNDFITVTLYDAGHMLGSSIVVLDIKESKTGPTTRLVFSGDLGRPNIPILCDPAIIDTADILLVESTYGGRTHPPIEDSAQALKEIITRTYRRGGRVIIPAFAVERTQLLVYMLNKLYHNGELPGQPIYVDSPLAVNVTEVFRKHPQYFDDETMRYLKREDPDGDIFGFDRLQYIRDVEQSKELNTLQGPCVIISASGMAEAGRIQHHLKNNMENPNNTILIVGWQAPDTLGRRLVEKVPKVKIFGEEHFLKAEVVTLNGFSGHADHQGLVSWVQAFKKCPKHVFVVHGDPEASQALAVDLRNVVKCKHVQVPGLGQTIKIS
ncbi:MAG: MBL fold metallo-hydrolase [Anaerolineae bacterium]|nr:MBL fold metallo-hydrolase [Anaerolineae bacterium]